MSNVQTAPLRPVKMGSIQGLVERRVDGTWRMTLDEALRPYPTKLTDVLAKWARERPDQIFLAQRAAAGGWRTLTYAQMLARARSIGQALLDRGLSAERPVAILSENDLENAQLALACYYVGVPYVPISPSYSLLASDFAKLRYTVEHMTPGLVFASNGKRYARAIEAVIKPDTEVALTSEPLASRPTTSFEVLAATNPTSDVDAANGKITPDTIGKFLFTSGTSGLPKAVIFPQRMLCSNRQQVAQTLAFVMEEAPVMVDWLPWHHTFGGTQNFGLALYGGGTLYIDHGKPAPGAVEPTVQTLREIAPTVYFNTPKGFEVLLPYLQAEPDLRKKFFSRLQLIYYGAAVLPLHIWEALDCLAVETIGKRVLIVSGLGSTETGPVPTSANWDPQRQALVGLPVPGVELKIAPTGNKSELRVRGPCVTPGYWRDPARTRAAFDDEGFFCMGDAVRFIDDAHPEKGLKFDGRISENFKLTSGTWVSVVDIRDQIINHCAPLVREAVIAGHNQDTVAALIFPDFAACRALDPMLPPDAGAAQVVANPVVRARFQQLFDTLAAKATGGSNRVVRVVLETEDPTLDTGEVTDKSTISQQAVLARRARVVEELYSSPPPARVITVKS